MPAPRIPYTPEFLSRYRPEQLLGEGGMGFVQRAFDTKLGRPVAIKFLRNGFGGDAVAHERFLREARVTGALEHPNVVRIYDTGLCGEFPYAVYELIQGIDLKRWIESNGAMEAGKAVVLVCEALDALEAAHRAGIIHRDVKPANVLLDANGVAKVADFGIARVGSAHGLTQAGTFLGTPGYVAPEQMEGAPPDARSDVYSAAAMLYELVAGAPPFQEADAVTTLARQAAGPPEPLDTKARGLPRGLTRLLERALDPRPECRPASAAALAEELRALAASDARQTIQRTVSVGRQFDSKGVAHATVVRPVVKPTRSVAPWLAAAVVVAGIAAAIALRRPADVSAPPNAKTAVPAPPVTPPGTVAAFNLGVSAGPTRIRARAWTNRPVSLFLTARSPEGNLLKGAPGSPAYSHDLAIEGLHDRTRYNLGIESADPGVRIAVADKNVLVATTVSQTTFDKKMNLLFGSLTRKESRADFTVLLDLCDSGERRVADRILESCRHDGRYCEPDTLRRLAKCVGPEHEEPLLQLFLAGKPWTGEGLWQFTENPLGAAGGMRTTTALLDAAEKLDIILPGVVLNVMLRIAGRSLEVRQRLAEETRAKSFSRRMSAGTILAMSQSCDFVHELARLIPELPNDRVRELFLRRIACSPDHLNGELEKLALSPDPRAWLTAMRYIPLASSESLTKQLRKTARSGKHHLVEAAVRTLGRIAGRKGLEVWTGPFSRQPALMRPTMASALAELDAVETLPEIVAALDPKDGAAAPLWVAAGWLAGVKGASEEARKKAASLFRTEIASAASPLLAVCAWGLGRAGEAGDFGLLERLVDGAAAPVRLRALEGMLYLDPMRCRQKVARLQSSDSGLPDLALPQLVSLGELAGATTPVSCHIFIPEGVPLALVGSPVRAGDPLQIATLGLCARKAPSPHLVAQIWMGSTQVAAGKVRAIALDDGPVKIQVPESPPPDGDGFGWLTVWRW